MKKVILVIGSLNMDLSVSLRCMPQVGETVLGQEVSYEEGGKGANQACAAGMLGGNVKMLGCTGDDGFGRKLQKSLEDAGVDAASLKISQEHATGMAVIYVDANGDNSIVVIPGANTQCDVSYLEEMDGQIRECDYVIMQMEIPYETVYYGASRAKELGKTVILNPAPVPEHMPDELLKLIDYITPNETELKKLTGIGGDADDLETVKKGTEKLLEKGVQNVVVTLGSQGAFWAGRQGGQFFPARKVKAVDTTAAGDCFNGAFAVGLSEGMAVGDAIQFANMAASVSVTRKGAQPSLPGREELRKLDAQAV